MNPLDFTGREFLAFYVMLSVATLIVVAFLRRMADRVAVPGANPAAAVADPYLVAYLRGGANEALRVAAISLVDRGLLVASGSTLYAAKGVKPAHARRPIEQAILGKFATTGEAKELFSDKSLAAACKPYEHELQRMRLIPDAMLNDRRRTIFWLAFLFLTGVAAAKIWVALARGRTNIVFLIVLWFISWIALVAISFPRRTTGGNHYLSDLQRLFGGLKDRASTLRPGGASNELPLLAAVFGAAAIPAAVYPWTRELFPQASASSSSGSSCGSSCGSSSSCGGGGCGGGCGGCGG